MAVVTPKTLVVALASSACLAAAGAGGYMAVRTNSATQPAQAAQSAPVPSPAPAVPGAAPSTTVEVQPEKRMPVVRTEPRDRTTPRESAPAPAPKPRYEPARPAPEAPAPATTPAPQPAAAPAPTPTLPADVTPASVPDVVPAVKDPEKPKFAEVIVKSDSVIGIRLDSSVTSETARVEDRVSAKVSRDVMVDDRVAIPAGSRLEGNVTLVERGGRFKERARLGVRFTSLVLADGATRLPLDTDTIFRDGDSPTGEATSKIGASVVVGAILGAVVGGKKGAAIGSTAGAAGGTAAVMSGSRNAATLPAGTPLTVRLNTPVTVLVERDPH
jgi:outer membrane biosynthesis protein TonB